MLGQLIFREKSYDVVSIETLPGFFGRSMNVKLSTELPENARDKIAVLVRGANRDPVRVGYARPDNIIEVSYIY